MIDIFHRSMSCTCFCCYCCCFSFTKLCAKRICTRQCLGCIWEWVLLHLSVLLYLSPPRKGFHEVCASWNSACIKCFHLKLHFLTISLVGGTCFKLYNPIWKLYASQVRISYSVVTCRLLVNWCATVPYNWVSVIAYYLCQYF